MAMKKKIAKKAATDVNVEELHNIAGKINEVSIPKNLQDRFDSQLTRITARLHKIADNLQKAITLAATKAEREAKKAEHETERIEKLTKQLETGFAKLKALKAKAAKTTK